MPIYIKFFNLFYDFKLGFMKKKSYLKNKEITTKLILLTLYTLLSKLHTYTYA